MLCLLVLWFWAWQPRELDRQKDYYKRNLINFSFLYSYIYLLVWISEVRVLGNVKDINCLHYVEK